MQPRSDEMQRCVRFDLTVSPDAKLAHYYDYLGNTIHTFDIPAPHTRFAIRAEAIVEIRPLPPLPAALSEDAWAAIDEEGSQRDVFDLLLPGRYTPESALLDDYAREIDWRRRSDPLSLIRELNTRIYKDFDYQQNVTRFDSTIDKALSLRRGVCQDFAHIMLVLLRKIGIPCRYVSGYLFYHQNSEDRSVEDASHAWVEAWLPELGWTGFDPTNNLIVSDRHIRVSVGNDYADASPSRGMFKGKAESELSVRVQVLQLDELPMRDVSLSPEIAMPRYEYQVIEQQQQQQQQ